MKANLVKNMRIVARNQGPDLVIKAQPNKTSTNYVFGSLRIRDGLIFNFGVHASFRRYGIGKRLFRASINRPDLPTTIKLYAKAEPGGMPQKQLEAFYKSFGFKATGYADHRGKQMQLDRNSTADTAAVARVI